VDELRKILEFYPADCRPTRVEPLGSAGGMSGAQFWRLVAPRGTLLVRCWPIEHPSPERLTSIHAVLRHAAAKGMTIIPAPFLTTHGESFVNHVGRLWELAPWMPGIADYDRAPRREKLGAAMMALARFHVAVADYPARHSSASAPAVAHRLARLRELQKGGVVILSRRITTSTWAELAAPAREFVALLPAVVPNVVATLTPLANEMLPLQMCLRDVWHDHVLFTGDAVTGIVDFGAVDVDTPATDVARLLGSLVGDEAAGWTEGLQAYKQVRPLSPAERPAVPALDAAGTVLAGCNWIRWIYVDGREFEDRSQIISRFERLLTRARRLANS
jgi:homoserine kinase type II